MWGVLASRWISAGTGCFGTGGSVLSVQEASWNHGRCKCRHCDPRRTTAMKICLQETGHEDLAASTWPQGFVHEAGRKYLAARMCLQGVACKRLSTGIWPREIVRVNSAARIGDGQQDSMRGVGRRSKIEVNAALAITKPTPDDHARKRLHQRTLSRACRELLDAEERSNNRNKK
ncbi:hypothetical protein DFH07DRAFT_763803 [Mycena maculata]|uniref:Uncharacterized protein n=1 Tax=Mycena maculata TaxID=230809 RepID=A0AAD7P2S6_9AGAR|nr:hypothetical protein DFH07DRAFT_763803 [Mycena maculata]